MRPSVRLNLLKMLEFVVVCEAVVVHGSVADVVVTSLRRVPSRLNQAC